ncbi:protein MAK16 homolog isoform X2 [Ananas comosus]|uniref:Protein MAK16 homolog n=1 Tax=Ananas comosus TaxID=4615 RepID=A0A6P5G2Z7_ANACO|nr:protein MAK16 homolog isoform X2 [Ananas comosus]
MQHDDVIWQVIRHNHCSYMAKITTGIFCRNPYNVTGICNRSSCPLANSRYATIRDHEGVFYLYMKTIERAHTPNKLWERVKLPRNYEKALEVIDKHLEYWPKLLVHKIKQRLTKMTQYRIRMRKLQLKVREKIMTVPRKEKKREARREEKAERAALIDNNIQKELVERLKKGVYPGEIVNIPEKLYNEVVEMEGLKPSPEEEEEEEEEDPEVEYVEGYDELEEEEDMEDFGGFPTDELLKDDEYVDMDEESELNSGSDRKIAKKRRKGAGSDAETLDGSEYSAKLKRKGKVIIEVEGNNDMADRRRAEM